MHSIAEPIKQDQTAARSNNNPFLLTNVDITMLKKMKSFITPREQALKQELTAKDIKRGK